VKNFINFILELFNTKNYTWIQKGEQNIAKFDLIETYYIHLDSIGIDAYNLYFYCIDMNKNKIFNLINNTNKTSFKVLSNVKNSVEDFMKNNKVDFIGYSSHEKERIPLYMLMLQNLCRENDTYSFKKKGNKTYYFLYDKNIRMDADLYIKRFMENDDKLKK